MGDFDETFDCLSVDACRSTNDTVLVLANGRAGAVDGHAFTDALTAVCGSLAEQMARDAEGATKFVTVRVEKGRTEAECRQVAYAIAHSPLVKTAFFASDPNLGRILAVELLASARAIELLRDDRLREDMGRAGREWVTREWTWERSGERFRALLDGWEIGAPR